MRRSLAVAVFVILSALPVSLLAQQLTQTTTAPTRDQQAIAVLQQSFAAMGKTLPADSVATGMVTIIAGTRTETGTIRILTRGSDQTIEELDTDLGRRKLVYSRLIATEVEDTVTHKLSGQLAATSQANLSVGPRGKGNLRRHRTSVRRGRHWQQLFLRYYLCQWHFV